MERGCSLLSTLTSRQLGFPHKKYQSFTGKHCETLQTLETSKCLSLKVNKYSTAYEPIPIYCLEKADDRLIASDEHGLVHIIPHWFQNNFNSSIEHEFNISSAQLSEKTAVYSVKCVPGGKLLAGTGSGCLCILDMNTLDLIKVVQCHEKSIKRVDSFTGDVIVTCSRDNTIKIHDVRIKGGKPVNVINEAHTVPLAETPPRNKVHKSSFHNSSASNCVTDVAFIDEFNVVSSGAADGLIKQWDLRLSYKLKKKFKPVALLEYPDTSNTKGYGCLKISGSKLYASSVQYEIFQFDLNKMEYEMTYRSPSKLSFYTKLDVNYDGRYIASGSEDQKVHLFRTVPRRSFKRESYTPVHTLSHSSEDEGQLPVCCALFSPRDDLMITTGDDTSTVTKWVPRIYLRDSSSQKSWTKKTDKLTNGSLPELKSEFKYMHRTDSEKAALSLTTKAHKSQRLDSFPNYVIDGMRLPHVVPRIRIKLRNQTTSANNWLRSPDPSSGNAAARRKAIKDVEETTPKSKTRKRRKFSDDSLSPKIFNFFKLSSPIPSPTVTTINEH